MGTQVFTMERFHHLKSMNVFSKFHHNLLVLFRYFWRTCEKLLLIVAIEKSSEERHKHKESSSMNCHRKLCEALS